MDSVPEFAIDFVKLPDKPKVNKYAADFLTQQIYTNKFLGS
jgi:hypothetical protein